MRALLLLSLAAALGTGRVSAFPASGAVLRPPDVSYQSLSAEGVNFTWVEAQHTSWGSGELLASTSAPTHEACVTACLDDPDCAWCSWCGLEVSGGRRQGLSAGGARGVSPSCAQPLLPGAAPTLPLAGRMHLLPAPHGLPGVLALHLQLHACAAGRRQRPGD